MTLSTPFSRPEIRPPLGLYNEFGRRAGDIITRLFSTRRIGDALWFNAQMGMLGC